MTLASPTDVAPAASAAAPPVPSRRTGRWIDDWRPEDPDFWETTGRAVVFELWCVPTTLVPERSRLVAMVKQLETELPSRRDGSSLHLADGPVLLLHDGGVLLDGTEVRLSPAPAVVLQALVANPGNVVSRQALLAMLPSGTAGSEHAVEMAVTRLRAAIGTRAVQTVVKRGSWAAAYRLVPTVQRPEHHGHRRRRPRDTAQVDDRLRRGEAQSRIGHQGGKVCQRHSKVQVARVVGDGRAAHRHADVLTLATVDDVHDAGVLLELSFLPRDHHVVTVDRVVDALVEEGGLDADHGAVPRRCDEDVERHVAVLEPRVGGLRADLAGVDARLADPGGLSEVDVLLGDRSDGWRCDRLIAHHRGVAPSASREQHTRSGSCYQPHRQRQRHPQRHGARLRRARGDPTPLPPAAA